MKVLHVLNSNKYSGAEGVVCQIINMFKSTADIEMVYCSPDGSIRETLKERDIPFLPLNAMNKNELKKMIEEYDPDVVYAHDMKACFISSLVVENQKLIFHIHNNAFDSRRVSLKSVAFLLASSKAEHIFWVSDAAREGYFFKHFVRSKSSVLYNIINVSDVVRYAEEDCNSYSYDAVFLGRLSKEKDPIRLINIFGKVVKMLPSATLAVVGDGNLSDEVSKAINDQKLPNNVFMLGFKKNPYKILKDAKVMIMSSLWEGMPMCALEAQALGVPIVSTPTDGLKYILKSRENGFTFDDDEEIAETVSNIIKDDKLHKRLSINSVEWSLQHNDLEKYKKKIMDFF